MRTLLELIEGWHPCARYYDHYIPLGVLTPQTTIKDILYSREIRKNDKAWFFDNLINTIQPKDLMVEFMPSGIKIIIIDLGHAHRPIYCYDYETFLAMIYEMLEHTYEDVAI